MTTEFPEKLYVRKDGESLVVDKNVGDTGKDGDVVAVYVRRYAKTLHIEKKLSLRSAQS